MTLLSGITARKVPTDRYEANILERAGDSADGTPVVFIHGNVSSSLFWQPTMLRLPADHRAIAIDLRGFGDSETKPVDATRGLGDFSDDIASVLDALDLDTVNLVGWSMGGGVVMQFMLEHPGRARTVTLQAPVSPYGFGPTARDGSLLSPDAAGSGAGGVNPGFIERLREGDTSDEDQTSPRSVYRSSYVKPGFVSEHEDVWVESMLTTKVAEGSYPGDSKLSANWPGFAPGDEGVLNTMAPTRFNTSAIVDLAVKPPLLWIHGTDDAIVSDASFFDFNHLGALGVIPGWPGAEIAPAQEMVSQTRDVLTRYRDAGGSFTELELADCGHSPQLEKPAEFDAALHAHVR
ncbi:MAG: alpha/beta hydrolase [Cryobacterium sp.]|nr:alpha/beta hydrolase [Cryobacterium sp.]